MNALPVVVIDPGHGGKKGTRNRGSSWNRALGPNGLLEKDLTLDLALRVAARLEKDAVVKLTRSTDTNPSLSERADVARQNNAAVFLSLHLNGSEDPAVDGTDVYVGPNATAPTRAFADALRERISKTVGTATGGLSARDIGTIRPERHAADTAAVLIEIAYLTNARQAGALEQDSYRNTIADGIADTIREHLTTRTGIAAEAFRIDDGPPLASRATADCFARVQELRNNAAKATNPNVVAAQRILKETGVSVDANPYLGITQLEIEAVVRAAYHTRCMPEILLALWAKEGSTRSVTAAVAIPQATTDANARTLFRSKVFYEDLGLDHFIATRYDEAAKDNVWDSRDGACAQHEARFTQRVRELVADRMLAEDIAGEINRELTVTGTTGSRKVVPSTRFYTLCLMLADAFWSKLTLNENRFPRLSELTEGLNYIQWNVRDFGAFVRSADGHRQEPQHRLNGKPISIEQWALHTKPLASEFGVPRTNAIKFEHYVESYRPIFKNSMTLIKPGIEDLRESRPGTRAAEYEEQPVYYEQSASGPGQLPLILAGPVVRRATRDAVWFWYAISRPPQGVQPKIVAYDRAFVANPVAVRAGDFKWTRLGENIWTVLCSVVPESGAFPVDTALGYDLNIQYEMPDRSTSTNLSDLKLNIAYKPFLLPSFVIGSQNSKIAHGSCRRPGARGEDAFLVFDQWMSAQASNALARPASLILTGDQIYADDVALPLWYAVKAIAADVFGYVESVPKHDGPGLARADAILAGPAQVSRRRQLTGRIPIKAGNNLPLSLIEADSLSPIGFSTDDGEAHLMSFPEYAAMYLAVWNEQLCRQYKVDDGKVAELKDFATAVAACRRVLANCSTYMLFDDHDVTDDWNLDKVWRDTANRNPLGRRIIANGLGAYWSFQAWGNDPAMFSDSFARTLEDHWEKLRKGKGVPDTAAAAAYEKALIDKQWTFVAATNPKAVCVDTRTTREYPTGKTAVLSGASVQRNYIGPLLRKSGFRSGDVMLLVLPSPFLHHRSMLAGQEIKYPVAVARYRGDYEFYSNNSAQRAEMMLWLKKEFNPSAVVIFSGDIHHGSVITGRYAYGRSVAAVKAGKADWAIRVVQVTASPIKNVDKKFVNNLVCAPDKVWKLGAAVGGVAGAVAGKLIGDNRCVSDTDLGNISEEVVPQWEHQYARAGDEHVIAMQSAAQKLKGDLGRETYIFENHLAVVDMPKKPGGSVHTLFVGTKQQKLKTAQVTVDTDNNPKKFHFQQIGPFVLPPRD